ncbi:tryptophan synthase subunit alpha [Candidatus Karelsulcia muelleri]|uniref:tryptophan synthase subunit alpha n=1 Tax=Candidatus Karelsulcia muelleri TaxID=336810 RepID=UPI000B9263DA|nr:tryptophan synthase subunit alpha [Candidatus Karelsulcia muelleri]ASS46892.1 Tryptophan synthase alpha chain [Candidatus Karelsulcia muelleri]
MNKIKRLFINKKKNILNIYFTAGYPSIDSMPLILKILQNLNIDIVEIGIPYSDPLADGNIIQKSNTKSLKNGMNISVLFYKLKKVKKYINIPIILMGYYNQFIKYGEIKFLEDCIESGVSGLILPDLPPSIYLNKYKKIFKKYKLAFIVLITPQTSLKRIKMLSSITDYFLYIVSSNSTTGTKNKINFSFLERIKEINVPKLIGFGICDKKSLNIAFKYAEGAIIGSAFIKAIKKSYLEKSIEKFIKSIIK